MKDLVRVPIAEQVVGNSTSVSNSQGSEKLGWIQSETRTRDPSALQGSRDVYISHRSTEKQRAVESIIPGGQQMNQALTTHGEDVTLFAVRLALQDLRSTPGDGAGYIGQVGCDDDIARCRLG